MKSTRLLAFSLLLAALPAHAQTTVVKANNGTSMTTGSSWVGGTKPGPSDIAVFNDVFTRTATFGTGSPAPDWLGLRVEGSSVTTLISVNNTTYANYVRTGTGGIDMSAAPRDFKVVGYVVGGDQIWDIANGRTLTLGGTRFSGTGNVSITGDGRVVINKQGGADTYTGTLTVSGGTLDLNNAVSLKGTGAHVAVNAGGTLDSIANLPGNLTVHGGSVSQTGSIAGNLTVADGATFGNEIAVSGNTVFGSSTGATLGINPLSAGALATGNLTLDGTNTVKLTGLPASPGTSDVVTYSGTLTGGTTNLQLDPSDAASFRNAPTFADTGNAITLSFTAGDNITWTGANGSDWDVATTQNWDGGAATEFYQLDSVTFTNAGAGSVNVTEDVSVGSMTFSNPGNAYTLSGNSITLGSGISATGDATINSALTLGAAQTFSAATGTTLKLGGLINASSSQITIDGAGTVELNNGGSANQISNGAGIVKNGNGLLIMSGRNTNSGDVTVNGGTVRFQSANWSAANFGGGLTINAGATAQANGQVFGNGGRIVDINDGTLTLIGSGTYVGSGTGTNTWDGATVNDTGNGDIRADGTFFITGDTPSTVTVKGWRSFNDNIFNVENVTSDASVDFTMNGYAGPGFYDNGTRTLTKSGAGTMEILGLTDMDGGSTINITAGTLLINSEPVAGSNSAWNFADGTGLGGEGGVGGSLSLGTATGAKLGIDVGTTDALDVGTDLALGGTSVVSLTGTPHSSGALTVLTYGGTLTGAPATQFTLDPASAADYRSSSFADAGSSVTLSLGSKALVWNGSSGSEWDLRTSSRWNAGETDQFYWGDEVIFDDTAATGAVTVDASAGAIRPTLVTVNNSSLAYTFTGDAIEGPGALTKDGTGTLTLSNSPNTYTGGTTISGGTLGIAANDTLPLGGDLTANSPGTFDMAGFDQTLGTLNGSGSVTTGGGALTVGSGAFSGAITENGSLTKTGAGTLILSGANTYSGTTTIEAGGTLQIGDGGTTGTIGSGALTNNGTLAYALSSDVTVSNLGGSGALEQVGPGTLFITDSSNTYSGGTVITGGTLQVGNAGTTGALPAGSLTNNATLVFDRSDDITMDGLTGGGVIVQQGAGTLFVNGAIDQNSTTDYPTWNFNAGTVSVSNRDELHNDGINAPATVFTFDGGTLRFDDWVGGETFGGYKLVQIESGGATLSPDAGLSVTVDSPVNGTGDLEKSGEGTLILSAANTFTGNTTVTAGTLQLVNASALAASSQIIVGASAVLDTSALGGFTLSAAQTVSGNGNIVGDTTIAGTLAPGESIGTLTFDAGLVLAGGTDFEIDATTETSDLSVVAGALVFGGDLDVVNLSGSLTEGQIFDLFDFNPGLSSGAFATVNLPGLDPGLAWDDTELYSTGEIVVVPEPQSALLVLLALAGFVVSARRRRD